MVAVAIPVSLLSWSTWTTITVDPPVEVIGFQTPVKIHLENPHGERTLRVDLEQDGKTYNVSTEVQPTKRLVFSRGHAAPRDLTVNAGKQATPALHDGKAQLLVTAVSNDFRGVTTSRTFDVDVMTAAPHVAADGMQHYINQGGSEM